MAANTALAFVPRKRRAKNQAKTAPSAAVRKRWKVLFSRFFPLPSPVISPYPDLVPLIPKSRRRRSPYRWISSSSSALLQLSSDHSTADVILTVCLNGMLLEEHYVSKLQYVWPQASCNPEIPARGTRAVFISYRDNVGEVQKFALRFLSVDEAERFMISLKAILNVGRDNEPLNTTNLGSEVSSEFEFMSSYGPLNRVCSDLNIMTPYQNYAPQISPRLNNDANQYSRTQEMTNIHNFHRNFADFPRGFTTLLQTGCNPVVEQGAAQSTVSDAFNLNSQMLPPSFTSWLGNSHSVVAQAAAQSTVSQEVNLISQIERYGGKDSFLDLLSEMERVISEMGGDLSL